MSKKIYISFLGTNDYLNCNYVCPGKEKVDNIKYIQEAVISQYCKDFDKFIFFLTEESIEKNWHDNGHKDKLNQVIENKGLYSRLQKLGLKGEIKTVQIKEGFNNNEIWEIFNKIYNEIDEDAKIVFDITHAFRFLPMLGMVLINYLKTLKNASILGIYYGAFEALGPGYEIKRINIEDRNVDVLDLTNFSLLQDWTIAANALTEFGDIGKLVDLAKSQISPILKETKGKDEDAQNMRHFITPLKSIFEQIATCRGKNIYNNDDYDKVNESLEKLKREMIPPMTPLIEKLEERLSILNSNYEIMNGFRVIKWCIDYNWIQQGYTILFETVISYILKCNSLDYNIQENRDIASRCFKIFNDDIPENEWFGINAENKIITRDILNSEEIKLLGKYMATLQSHRNDINHCGFRDSPIKSSKIKENLENIYCEILSKVV